MNRQHLEKFISISEADHKWVGIKQRDWWDHVFTEQKTKLNSLSVSRDELKGICADPQYTDIEVFAAVMAWGGMRRNHGRVVTKYIDEICKVVSHIRHEELSAVEAYTKFYKLRMAGKLPCMTAAYFSKVIFFCSPRHDGYIMDQWTSKSVNLICEEKVVSLTYGGHVSDKNKAESYLRFCNLVEELGHLGGWSPEETEIRLFSSGGRTKGAWRDYLIKHWRK